MGKIANTWSLMGASWELLKKDKEILVFPLLSGLSCLLVLLSFALPLFFSGALAEKSDLAQPFYYGVLFLFYVLNYFVITFFNSAIIACAAIRMAGGDPTVADGFKAAMERLPLILGWAALAATVGIVLRMIEDRSEILGKIVAGLLGMAWTMTSFLVIPILVLERKGPVDALKASAKYFKRSWGEQITSNFSFGLVFFLLSLGGIPLILIGLFSGIMPLMVVFVALAVLYWIALSLVQTALQSIFQTALYLYVKESNSPQGYPTALLEQAMRQK